MDMQHVNYDDARRPASCSGYIHVIEAGDTLYKLAKKYDVKLFDIMRLNPYVNVYNLQIGDEICIPTTAGRPEKVYVVNEGDDIEDVLKAFQTGFDNLSRYNPTLLEVELPEGLVLKMPRKQPRNGMEEEWEDMDD